MQSGLGYEWRCASQPNYKVKWEPSWCRLVLFFFSKLNEHVNFLCMAVCPYGTTRLGPKWAIILSAQILAGTPTGTQEHYYCVRWVEPHHLLNKVLLLGKWATPRWQRWVALVRPSDLGLSWRRSTLMLIKCTVSSTGCQVTTKSVSTRIASNSEVPNWTK